MRRRNVWITIFVIAWTLVFHYETLRLNYLSPLAGRQLPKLPFLFPPAGWIMFFNVDKSYGFAEVYGLQGERVSLIDPHDIFPIRNVGYDNIHRNVLISVLSRGDAAAFCGYLRRTFPEPEEFVVVYAEYPDLIATPETVRRAIAYRCP